jgi:pyrimidine-nucleoside phosphorylase
MRPQDIIAIKRDGGSLSAGQIDAFINGVCDNSWADYQISAMVMAMFMGGLDQTEQAELTRAMLHSGSVLDLSDLDRPKADKHSTGGVGDKTSLIIAPLVASCGAVVPMVSGRGLGHTGGTLDKLESIPGYNVNLSIDEFKNIVRTCGFAMTGQTSEIVPADKKLYALRDATATVPCIPLIVASIMSKKLAEGLDALVSDVKTGSGAFMESIEDARRLAESLVLTGKTFGLRTEAVISDMSQPLGRFVGNGLEVFESIKIMRGELSDGMEATRELSLELAARMLVLSDIAADVDTARAQVSAKLDSGDALEKFRSNIELQGGDAQVCDRPESLLNDGSIQFFVNALSSGFVSDIDTLAVGMALAEAGGGRTRAEDEVDRSVGIECIRKIGDEVREGDLLCIAYCRTENDGSLIGAKLAEAFVISPSPPDKLPNLIHEVIN